ncbi:hypothetical protein GJ496_004445 [Pomphorhynchus laevis]|nr:hypothetical protein GJ496_004445 [Pomphorhynchus laevis]
MLYSGIFTTLMLLDITIMESENKRLKSVGLFTATVNTVKDLYKQVDIITKNEKRPFILFFGSLTESGESWCSDCRNATEPIDEGLKLLPTAISLILCYIGDRENWKNESNEFRTDSKLAIKSVPTIFDFKNNRRLVNEEITVDSLNELLNSDEIK